MGGRKGSGQQAGYSLRAQLQKSGLTDLEPGAVITVPDKHLSFPHNLLNRTVHERRFGVVMSNHDQCNDHDVPIVVFIPMTSRIDIQNQTDVLIRIAPENGLEQDSLAQLALIQPVAKDEVQAKLGVLSDADFETLLERLVWLFAR